MRPTSDSGPDSGSGFASADDSATVRPRPVDFAEPVRESSRGRHAIAAPDVEDLLASPGAVLARSDGDARRRSRRHLKGTRPHARHRIGEPVRRPTPAPAAAAAAVAAPAPAKAASAWRGRAITLFDQGLSSVSNVLAVLLVAHAVSRDDFGRFSIAYAVLTLALGLSRSYYGTRVSLEADRALAHRLTNELKSTLILLAVPVAVLTFVVSLAASDASSLRLLVIVSLATPVVLIQDIIRFGSAASGRPMTALLSDGVWVAVMAVPFIFQIPLSRDASLTLWLVAALAALVLAQLLDGQMPDLKAGWFRLRERHPVGESVALGTLVATFGTLWTLFVVSHTLTPAAAGSLRGAATSMGPVNVLLAFASLGLTPALARRARQKDWAFCSATSLVLAGGALVWGLILLALPHSWGLALFKDSWDGIHSVLPFTVVEYVCLCLTVGSVLGLKVRARAGDLMTQRLTAAGFAAVGGTVAAVATRHVLIVSAALAAAALIAMIVGWVLLARSPAEPPRPKPQEDPAPQPTSPVAAQAAGGVPGPGSRRAATVGAGAGVGVGAGVGPGGARVAAGAAARTPAGPGFDPDSGRSGRRLQTGW